MLTFGVVVTAFVGLLGAGEIVVGNNPYCAYVRGDAGVADSSFTVSTVHQETFPTEVGTPIFWFDASDTNGWTFVEGTKEIRTIPSKVGDGRYLSTDCEGGNLASLRSFWALLSPTLEPQAEFGGKPAVDFGEMGSDRGLVFNPIANEQTGNVASNILLNIGTVIAVYGSQAGGGFFMSGGFGGIGDSKNWNNAGFWWLRSEKNIISSSTQYLPMNPVTRGSTPVILQGGSLYIDGCPYSIFDKGFGGCWEVVDVTPTENGMQASGLGFNDARHVSGINMSGGMKIAEMLVFGTCLTAEERVKVQRWLDRKWFGRSVNGVNGCGDLGTLYGYRADWKAMGFPITVNVPEGEELALSRNLHGRGGIYGSTVDSVDNLSSYVKTGAGTFALKDAENFQGVVRLREGTLRLPQRSVPAAIPADAFLHFDVSGDNVSSAVTTEEDGVEYVEVWRNLKTSSTFYDRQICARPPAAENRPVLLRDELGAGLNVLDFGPVVNSTTLSGRHLHFETNETAAVTKKVSITQCITVLAVVGAQYGGGYVVGADGDRWLRRGDQQPTVHTQALFAHTIDGQMVLVNGVPCTKDQCHGYETPGYQVLAMRQPKVDAKNIGNSSLSSIATGLNKSSGGCRIGELAIYMRALSDDEMRDASAALMRKWLGRTAPGYATPTAQKVPHLQNLMTEGDGTAAVDVPAGETVTVGTVSGGANLVKTGAGTLRIIRNALQNGAQVVCREGSVVYADAPDVTSACELAASPSLHLRADGKKELADGAAEGEKVVPLWYGEYNRNAAWRPLSDAAARTNSPTYLADGCNGKPALDFGALGKTRGGRDLALALPLNNVRAAYLLVKYHAQPDGVTGNYPMPLGSLSGSTTKSLAATGGVVCDFLRQNDHVIGSNPGEYCVSKGEFWIDGVSVTDSQIPTKETWQLVEYHTKGGAHVSALGADRADGGNASSGGFALAEVVLYERPLSAREKVATRNYLMKKWLGTPDEELAELPPVEAETASELTVDGAMELDKDGSVAVARLKGEGSFAKSGAGTLTLGDWSGFAGTVDIADGTLSVVKPTPPEGEGRLVTDGLILQMDASQGVTATTNASGVAQVTEWKSALNDGWRAVPLVSGKYPTLVVSDDLNGGCTVDMAANVSQGLRFQKDGVGAEIKTAKSIFWVIGSQNGGGFLMGGGHKPKATVNPHLAWHRGGGDGCGAAKAGDALLNVNHCETLLTKSAWRMNGTGVANSVGLSGAWDLLDVIVPESAAYGLQAEGFAFDGRYLDDKSMSNRIGCQRLAEVLVYDRRLTGEEVADVELYLQRKWHCRVQGGPTDGVDVNVGAEATLDLGGQVQSVGALTGAGLVQNGTVRPTALVADFAATAWPTIASLDVREGLVIDVRNVPANLDGKGTVKIADVGAIEGFAENRGSIVLTGGFPATLSAKLRYENGELLLAFRQRGMIMLLR